MSIVSKFGLDEPVTDENNKTIWIIKGIYSTWHGWEYAVISYNEGIKNNILEQHLKKLNKLQLASLQLKKTKYKKQIDWDKMQKYMVNTVCSLAVMFVIYGFVIMFMDQKLRKGDCFKISSDYYLKEHGTHYGKLLAEKYDGGIIKVVNTKGEVRLLESFSVNKVDCKAFNEFSKVSFIGE